MVEFDEVSLRLGGRVVLQSISFGLERGETAVILGQSGAGKSSALRLVNRLLEPTAGTVRVDGIPTTKWDPIELRRRIGYIIQQIGLFPHRTVAENVSLVPRLLGWERSDQERRTAEMLELVGLPRSEFALRFPAELSGGQQQRVGVARALAADPAILLADEPFGALDPVTRSELQREFQDLTHRLAKAVIFVTHDVREAIRIGDRILLLEEGRIAFSGTPAEFRGSELDAVRAFQPEAGE
jgi:osmoprotectant transport system ATP-binding protein